MFKNLKSQAALEFLTTYGWAFLVIMIMIGSLAYFGILSPSKLLPNRCNFGSEFSCIDYEIKSDGTFKLKLKNNLGEPITVAGGTAAAPANSILKTEDGTTITGCSFVAVATWDFAKNQDLTWGCAAGTWNKGDKAKVLVTVEYSSTKTGAYLRQVQGEVYATVT